MSQGLLGWRVVTREREDQNRGSWGRLPLSSRGLGDSGLEGRKGAGGRMHGGLVKGVLGI